MRVQACFPALTESSSFCVRLCSKYSKVATQYQYPNLASLLTIFGLNLTIKKPGALPGIDSIPLNNLHAAFSTTSIRLSASRMIALNATRPSIKTNHIGFDNGVDNRAICNLPIRYQSIEFHLDIVTVLEVFPDTLLQAN